MKESVLLGRTRQQRIRTVLWMLGVLTVLAFCSPTGAQGTAAPGGGDAAAGKKVEIKVFDHFVARGGFITHGILIPLSCVAAGFMIDYFLRIRRGALLPDPLKVAVVEHLQQGQFKELVELTARDPSLLGAALYAGFSQSSRGWPAMEGAMQEVLESRSAALFRRIEYLNIIGNVSPMIGLFGTVYGMIILFADMVALGGQPNPAKLADGISVALVATFWGLMIAVPSLSIFHIMRNRIDGLLADCVVQIDEIMQFLKPSDKGSLVKTKPAEKKNASAPTSS